jgi:hypothetical protein
MKVIYLFLSLSVKTVCDQLVQKDVYTSIWCCKTLCVFSFLGWCGTESTITQAITGLLYEPRMMEQSAECLAKETEELGENVHQFRFVHHKSHMTWPGLEPWPPP